MTQKDEIVDLTGESKSEPPHEVSIVDREQIKITGVKQVDTFDEREIVLQTEMGTMTLRGEDLHIEHLDLEEGKVECTGIIVGMQYLPGTSGRGSLRSRGIWEKIFH